MRPRSIAEGVGAIAVIVDGDEGPAAGFPFAAPDLGNLCTTVVNPYFGTTR